MTEARQTDAVIVPTGGAGRIPHGLEIVRSDEAQLMLVTGVDREVRPAEFAAEFEASMELMECCVTLGFEAVDTRGNATEAAQWVKDKQVRSLRLVTSDWHMRRAAGELRDVLPTNIRVIEDAVHTEPSLFTLFLEFNKFLASWISRAWPG
ncbi:YdcF family protein [Erythrobacter jejuensis]|uniref:YdcF family protein n=2 Tax=Parerythrobacter jejuensis TaxID=795812 RepID=A0A845AQX0_9SPHN|nr:YdcF family protein [Parerythrobacter jejuensis]MXP34045.1 YdcF family protein [Parerythrobacter jejuensis]